MHAGSRLHRHKRPVAALFVLMTKVGVYAILRVWMLLFPADAGATAQVGASILFAGGLATLAFGTLGVIGSIRLDRIAAFSILVSSGTLFAAFAIGSAHVSEAALFYLVSATLASSALFLLVETGAANELPGGAPAGSIRNSR